MCTGSPRGASMHLCDNKSLVFVIKVLPSKQTGCKASLNPKKNPPITFAHII